jgi:hypothetical protein
LISNRSQDIKTKAQAARNLTPPAIPLLTRPIIQGAKTAYAHPFPRHPHP